MTLRSIAKRFSKGSRETAWGERESNVVNPEATVQGGDGVLELGGKKKAGQGRETMEG